MGCLDMTDPLSLGFIGRNGAYPANEAGRHADVVIAIGARFDDRSSSSWMPGYSWNFPAQQADPCRCRSGTNSAATIRRIWAYWPMRATFLRQLLTEARARQRQCAEERCPFKSWRADIARAGRPNGTRSRGRISTLHASPIRPGAHRRRLPGGTAG